MIEDGIQNLVLIEKGEKDIRRKVICEVLYVFLRGRYARGTLYSNNFRISL